MKIVTLSSKDTYGGAAKVAYRLHRSLLSRGVDNTFVVNSKRSDDETVVLAGELRDRRSWLYYKIYNFLLKKKEKKRIEKWDRYLHTRENNVYLDLEISLLRDALDNIDFDLLQLHWVGESFVNFTEFRNIKKPVVWTLHDCFAFTGICTYFESCDKYKTHCGDCPQLHSGVERDFSYEVFEQKKDRYRAIDFHIVCPSNWLAGNARESALLNRFPVTVIPNGIDTEYFYPIPKEEAKKSLNIDSFRKVILFGGVGVHKDTRKGGHLLAEALRLLSESDSKPEDTELLVFGTTSLDFDIGYKTTFLGYIDDEELMRRAYSAADVLVVPSMYENLPTVIMEGLSCGTPVAAFGIGGNSDMIEHEVNGYLAKAYDTSDLAGGIRFCLENNRDNALSKNARTKVLENFRIEDVTRRYIQLYESILK